MSRARLFHRHVFGLLSFARYWLPVLLWMSLLFTASTDLGASGGTSRIIGPLLRWLFPQLSEPTVDWVVLLVRKTAHLTEYAILALLLWRALRKPSKQDPRPWDWRLAAWAVLLAGLYAASDEFHQSFVPSRMGSLFDVLLDTSGAAFGLLALWLWRRCRRPTTLRQPLPFTRPHS